MLKKTEAMCPKLRHDYKEAKSTILFCLELKNEYDGTLVLRRHLLGF